MKKIEVNQREIFKIAHLIKQKFPNNKLHLHLYNKTLIIKINKPFEVLKIKELKTFLEIKYPYLKISIQDY